MADRFTVEPGPSLYMSGESDWHIRRVDRPGILASFRASSGAADKIRDLLNESPSVGGAVPPEVTAVAGCDCGGVDWHRTDCTIQALPSEVAQAAIDAAHTRLQTFTDHLNERLHNRA